MGPRPLHVIVEDGGDLAQGVVGGGGVGGDTLVKILQWVLGHYYVLSISYSGIWNKGCEYDDGFSENCLTNHDNIIWRR